MADKAKKTTAKDAKVVKTVEDLQKDLATKRQDLLEAKRANAAGELVNPRVITGYRKEVARLLTEINQKKEQE